MTLAVTLFAIVVYGIAGAFAVGQRRLLLSLPGDRPAEDVAYFRRRAWRRLVGCGVLVLTATLLAAAYWSGLEARVQAVADDRARGMPLADVPRDLMRFYAGYWLAVSLLVLLLVGIGFWDAISTRRHVRRQLDEIREGRRRAVADGLAELRAEKRKLRERHLWN